MSHHNHDHDHEHRAPLLGERLDSGAASRGNPGPEEHEAGCTGGEDTVELELAVGRDVEPEVVGPTVLGHDGIDLAELDCVALEKIDREQPGDAERDAFRGEGRVVGPHLSGESRVGMRGVVPDELLVGVGPKLGRGTEVQEQRRVRVQPGPRHDRDESRRDHDSEGQVAHTIEGGREVDDEKHREALQHVDRRTGEPASSATQRQREVLALGGGAN